MTAKEQAIKDIREELREEGKCLIHFITELDPIMDQIVDEYSKEQEIVGGV